MATMHRGMLGGPVFFKGLPPSSRFNGVLPPRGPEGLIRIAGPDLPRDRWFFLRCAMLAALIFVIGGDPRVARTDLIPPRETVPAEAGWDGDSRKKSSVGGRDEPGSEIERV